MSNGASAPLFAQKFLPDVKVGDDIYNAAPFIHDGLYMWKGCFDGVRLKRLGVLLQALQILVSSFSQGQKHIGATILLIVGIVLKSL